MRLFLLAPPREGRRNLCTTACPHQNFYSRPHGRGDPQGEPRRQHHREFLLAPPREGRPAAHRRPCPPSEPFLLAPPREGRREFLPICGADTCISTRAPTGGATLLAVKMPATKYISTRAPTGGATAIFHKVDAVFCGELPKDHAVFYEIFPVCQRNLSKSRENQKNFCADLPRNYVREGSALEDQGASGFYERLFSHGLDPILIGIAQPIEADGVLLQVNDLFQFIF